MTVAVTTSCHTCNHRERNVVEARSDLRRAAQRAQSSNANAKHFREQIPVLKKAVKRAVSFREDHAATCEVTS